MVTGLRVTTVVRPAGAEHLGRLPLTPSNDSEGDQENHDAQHTDDVRHHGNRTGDIAGVGPDQADDRSHDEHGDHRSEPVQNPSSGNEPSLLSWGDWPTEASKPSAFGPGRAERLGRSPLSRPLLSGRGHNFGHPSRGEPE